MTVQTSKAKAAKDDDTKTEWSVVSADGRRVFFRGNEDDARDYVTRNYPHVHVEPQTDYGDDGPQPDVFLRDPSGSESGLVGKDWVDFHD